MKKKLLYTALGLIGIMGTLSIGVVSADCWSDNGATAPDSNSTYASGIVYGCDGNIPIITIYGENDNGDSVGITIKAMNEGTGTVKIGSGNDAASFGSHYQRGNSYPFPLEGEIMKGDDIIDVSGYGPGTASGYYESGVFLRNNYTSRIAAPYNDNLRGGTGDKGTIQNGKYNGIYNGAFWGFNGGSFTVTNPDERRVMCDTGYHIPSQGERNALLYLRGKNYNSKQNKHMFSFSLNSLQDYSPYNPDETRKYELSRDLFMPFAGGRNGYNNINGTYFVGIAGSYWSSSSANAGGRYFAFSNEGIKLTNNTYHTYGFSVRCFRNSYIVPQIFNLYFMANTGDSIGDEVGTGIVTENMTGSVPDEAKNVTKIGYVLEYRYLSGVNPVVAFDFTGTAITSANADASGNVYFIAQWTGIKYSVEFTGTDVSGTMANQEFTYGVTGALTANSFTKTGYTFSGWIYGTTGYADEQEISNLTTISGDVVTLTAERTANTYTVKFNAGGGNGTMNDQEFIYDVAQDLTGNKFTRDGYTFSGWTDGTNVYTDKQSVKNLTGTNGGIINLTAQWKQNTPSGGSSSGGGSSGGGGGGGGTTKVTTQTTVNTGATNTGDKVDSKVEETVEKENGDKNENSWCETGDVSEVLANGYTREMNNAYTFAYNNKITTRNTIEEADMDKPLTRIAMAKMLSYYAINVLGKEPDTTRINKFKDVSDKLDAQYDNGVKLAYQLGIMGINMKNNKFRPNDYVTRAEFGTALSRLLFGIEDGKDKYYSTHLAKLMEEGIITNDNPTLQELRGYVMIMLMRSVCNLGK